MGLDEAEVVNSGWRNEFREPLDRDSQSALRLDPLEVGEESGGVTGALLDILRGGRLLGMAAMLRRNGRR